MAVMSKSKRTENRGGVGGTTKRKYVSQADVPSYPLTQAIRIPRALADNFASKDARPIQLAQALNVQPTSGTFRMLCGSAIAYGLTEGGYNAATVSLTSLGKRIVTPTSEGDDAAAMREAMLKPRVLMDFLRRYDNSKLPREDIACNVIAELGVPREDAKRTFDLIVDGAKTVGFLRQISGADYVDLQGVPQQARAAPETETDSRAIEVSDAGDQAPETGPRLSALPPTMTRKADAPAKVFIAHGRDPKLLEQVKTMLNVAEVEYEIAEEEQTAAIPVPEKVSVAMRKCNAALICVTGNDVNQNVLIEIGAAFVLYGNERVILLWQKGTPVPSNLQGLYRSEFERAELSWSEGMRLMEAIKKLKA
jgi:hypothetical protein